MGIVVRIVVNRVIIKLIVIYIKFDDRRVGINLIQGSGSVYVREYGVVFIELVLIKIKFRLGKLFFLEV